MEKIINFRCVCPKCGNIFRRWRAITDKNIEIYCRYCLYEFTEEDIKNARLQGEE